MTKPKSGEKQQDFISRCHSAHASEYPDKDQRHAMCMSIWNETKKEKAMKSKVNKALNELDKLIKGMEKEKVYKSVLVEIPKHCLGVFPVEGQRKFKSIYLDNRLAGVSKSESLELTTNLVTRAYVDNKGALLQGILKTLTDIKNRIAKEQYLGDETQIEEFPPKGEIPIIEDDYEDNGSETTTKAKKRLNKAEEGDKKMIFGKPYTYSGGKWEADGGGKQDSPEEEAVEDQLNEEEEEMGEVIDPSDEDKVWSEDLGKYVSIPEEETAEEQSKAEQLTMMEDYLNEADINTLDMSPEQIIETYEEYTDMLLAEGDPYGEVGDEDEDLGEFGSYKPHFEKVGDTWMDTNVEGSQAGVTDDDVTEMASALEEAGYDISQHDPDNPEDVSAIIDMYDDNFGPSEPSGGDPTSVPVYERPSTDIMDREDIISELKDYGYTDEMLDSSDSLVDDLIDERNAEAAALAASMGDMSYLEDEEGWASASDVKREEFADPSHFDEINELDREQINQLFKLMQLDPEEDISRNLKKISGEKDRSALDLAIEVVKRGLG